MAIALKSGELYFITEVDLFSGKRSGYYKIGLVKDVRQGDSSTRLDEHQTGNPRQLELSAVVTAPAIEALESAMHARFATERVRGEWFRLSPKQLASTVAAAEKLSAQLDEALPALTAADKAGTKKPTPTVGRPKADDVERHRQAASANHVRARVRKLKTGVTDLFRSAATDGVAVEGLVAFSKAATPTVSRSKVAAVRPDLAEKFTRTSETGGRVFGLLGATSKSVDVTVSKDFLAAEAELVALLEQPRDGRKHLENVHGSYLEVLRFSSEAEWAYEFAVAEIMASCGRRSGIDGICKWPLETKTSTSFDVTAFKKAHPQLAEQCMTRPSASFKVLTTRGYSPKQ